MFDSGFARAPGLLGYYFLIFAAATAHASYAIEAPLPSATRGDQQPMGELMGFSPKPTEPPRIRGRMASDALFARADTDNAVFCGYVSADPSSPVACADFRRICMFNTVVGAVGCCESTDSPAESCSQYTSCVNRRQITSCSGSCSVDPLIVTCSNTASPSCWTYQWIVGMSSLGCGPTSFFASVAVSYSGQVKPITTLATSTTATASSTGTSGSDSSDGGDDGAKIGPIVGGAVGGFAVLAGLIVALVYFISKHRQQKLVGSSSEKGAAAPSATQTLDQQQWSHDHMGYSPNTPTPMYGVPYGTSPGENGHFPKARDYYGQPPEPTPQELLGNARSELPTERFDPPAPPPPPLEPLRQEPAREPGATLFPPPAS